VTVFRGYLGQPGKENVRLYSSLDFSDYVDIPQDSVVLVVELRSPTDRLAGQAVWVKLDAEVTHGTTGRKRQPLREGLLDGGIGALREGADDARPGGRMTPSPWCGGRMSPSPWCGGRMSPRPWC
jgi:hypothetical protein